MRLLIIEDDLANAGYMARAFRESGHSADCAADGEMGLAYALRGQMTCSSWIAGFPNSTA